MASFGTIYQRTISYTQLTAKNTYSKARSFIFVEISKATIVEDEQVQQGFGFFDGDKAVKEPVVRGSVLHFCLLFIIQSINSFVGSQFAAQAQNVWSLGQMSPIQ